MERSRQKASLSDELIQQREKSSADEPMMTDSDGAAVEHGGATVEHGRAAVEHDRAAMEYGGAMQHDSAAGGMMKDADAGTDAGMTRDAGPDADDDKRVVRSVGAESSAGGETTGTSDTGAKDVGTEAGKDAGVGADAGTDAGGKDAGAKDSANDAGVDAAGAGTEAGKDTGANDAGPEAGKDAGVDADAGTEAAVVGTDVGVTRNVSVWDDIECKFNVNSYQMVFVANTQSLLYRRHFLLTARQVRQLYLRPYLNLHYLPPRYDNGPVEYLQCNINSLTSVNTTSTLRVYSTDVTSYSLPDRYDINLTTLP